jgi:hypothetical protein
MTRALTIAQRLLAKGLSIFPVPRPQPGTPPHAPGDGKTPALPWKKYQTTVATPERLEQWFATEQNIAVVTGAISRIVVLDIDGAAGTVPWVRRHLPRTPWLTKTARGWHLFYRHPGGRVPNKAPAVTTDDGIAIDVRGDGGYVIAPGSLHMSGTMYKPEGNWHQLRSALPIFSPTWIDQAPSSRQPVERTSASSEHSMNDPSNLAVSSSDRVERARKYLSAIPRPEIGAGSDQAVLTAAARLVRGFALAPSDAECLLWNWCGNRPGWTRQWIARKVKNAERYGTEQVGGLL